MKDDDEPVTCEWLYASGIPHNSIANGGPSRPWRILFAMRKTSYSYEVSIPAELVPTRKQVRLLCRAFGHPVRKATPTAHSPPGESR